MSIKLEMMLELPDTHYVPSLLDDGWVCRYTSGPLSQAAIRVELIIAHARYQWYVMETTFGFLALLYAHLRSYVGYV